MRIMDVITKLSFPRLSALNGQRGCCFLMKAMRAFSSILIFTRLPTQLVGDLSPQIHYSYLVVFIALFLPILGFLIQSSRIGREPFLHQPSSLFPASCSHISFSIPLGAGKGVGGRRSHLSIMIVNRIV